MYGIRTCELMHSFIPFAIGWSLLTEKTVSESLIAISKKAITAKIKALL